MKKKFFLFVALAIFGGLGFVVPAQALTISPAKGLVTVNRGAEQVVKVTVFNESLQTAAIEPVVLGTRQDESGKLIFEKDIDQTEKWVKVDKQIFTLSPGEKKDLFFTVKPPVDAYSGSHYLGLGVKTSSGEGAVGLSGQLLSTITVQVAGIANENLKITNFEANKKLIIHKNISFDLVVKNKGNVEITPAGQLLITAWGGKEIFNDDFYLGNQLLVDSERIVTHDFNLNKIFWPGIYQAKILLRYGLTASEVGTTTNFVYLPVWSWFGLAFLFGFVAAFLIVIFKKIKLKFNGREK